jgi:lysophospholipase L1-like esterase
MADKLINELPESSTFDGFFPFQRTGSNFASKGSIGKLAAYLKNLIASAGVANFQGIAYPDSASAPTVPQTSTVPQIWIGSPGTYSAFNGVQITGQAGFITGNPGAWVVENINIDLSAIMQDIPGAIINPGGTININTAAKTITVTGTAGNIFVTQGSNYYPVNPGTTSFVTDAQGTSGGLIFVVYLKSAQTINLYFFSQLASIASDMIVLGATLSFQTDPSKMIGPNDILVNGLSKFVNNAAIANKWDNIGTLVGNQGTYTINFNTATTAYQLEVSISGSLYVSQGAKFFPVVTAISPIQTTQTGSIQAAGINFVVYQLSTQKLFVFNYTMAASAHTSDFVYLGSFFDNQVQTLQLLGDGMTINGVSKSFNPGVIPESAFNKLGSIAGESNAFRIDIDTAAKTISYTGFAFAVSGNAFYSITSGTSDPIVTTGGAMDGILYLYYQISTQKIRLIHFTQTSVVTPNDYVLLGWCFDLTTGNSASYLYGFRTLIKEIFVNGVQIGNASAVPVTNELILPTKIWMLTGQKLPVYKQSIVRTVNELSNDLVLASLSTSTSDFDFPKFESIKNSAVLDPAAIKSIIRIYSKNYADTARDYAVDISVITTAPTAKTGQSRVWWCWGDSLTNRGVADYTKRYMTFVGSGLTLNNYGSMDNGSSKGEGREGWTWLNYIGADNTHLGDNTPITLTNSSTVGSLYSNPFLRLATQTDYTNNPNWCFRNTGSNSELSYSTDSNKTGNFYIFDPAYYAGQRLAAGGQTPDIITIALSTNDITENGASGVTNSLLGARVVLTQLKAAYPNAKIAVIPATGQGNNSTNWPYICDWIDQLNVLLTSLAFTNVDVVGVWPHMNKDYMFPYASNANLKTDGNPTIAYTKGEAIHFGQDGYLPYAKALGAWIINVA